MSLLPEIQHGRASVRRFVSIAGDRAQFALDSEGEGWFWTGGTWEPWGRRFIPPAPQTDAPIAQAMLSAQAEDRQRTANPPKKGGR